MLETTLELGSIRLRRSILLSTQVVATPGGTEEEEEEGGVPRWPWPPKGEAATVVLGDWLAEEEAAAATAAAAAAECSREDWKEWLGDTARKGEVLALRRSWAWSCCCCCCCCVAAAAAAAAWRERAGLRAPAEEGKKVYGSVKMLSALAGDVCYNFWR